MSSFHSRHASHHAELPGPAAIRLRPATAADDAVLLAIYASTRAEELALRGWDDATCAAFVQMQFKAQCLGYRQVYPRSEHSLIEVHDPTGPRVTGRLWLNRSAAGIHVLDISLLPAWRGQGLGGRCLLRLIAEVSASGGTLSLQV